MSAGVHERRMGRDDPPAELVIVSPGPRVPDSGRERLPADSAFQHS